MQQMKKTLALTGALATVLAAVASPALAATRHRAPVAADTDTFYGQPTTGMPMEVVTGSGTRIIADPDPNIRTQLLRDPDPTGF
jgi:uncharacterized membrane protein